MSCQYGFYKNNEVNRPRLYCKITNDLCVYSKLCLKPSVNKYIFNDRVDDCMIKKENERYTIPNGAYLVRFVKNGYVYVEVNDKVLKIKYDANDTVNYVYIKEKSDGTYEASTTPFITEQKNTKRKRNNKRVEDEGKNN